MRLARKLWSVEGVGQSLAVLACVWFALAAGWGLFSEIGAGHYAAMCAMGISADNMVQWRILGPVWDYVATAPSPIAYYCHHPWGPFWLVTALRAVFGRHDWIMSAPAVAMSAATPVLLYKLGKDAWGTSAGLAAAAGFAVLPIALGFANFHNLEEMVIFGWVLFFWGQVRLLTTWKTRYLLASLVGVAFTAAGDWPGYIALGVVLAWSLLRAYVLPPSWSPVVPVRRYAQWWALSATVAVLLLMLWIGAFQLSDKLGDLLNSAQMRGGGGVSTLDDALRSRAFWIDLMFTPPAIFLGKVALPVAVARVLFYRRDVEMFSLATLAAATVQYVYFKGGADIHIFWPHYYAAYFALAFAQLVATLVEATRYVLQRVGAPNARTLALAVGLVPAAAFPAILVPDAVRTLRYARETGGRYNEKGVFIRTDMDSVLVVKSLAKRGAGTLEPHPSVYWGWHNAWALGGPAHGVSTLPSGPSGAGAPFFLARASALTPEQLKELVSRVHVEVYEDIWVVDKRDPASALEAFTWSEREPNLFEWYFLGGVEPRRTLRSDPFATWEWRVPLGQAAEIPPVAPVTLNDLRIAHNMAMAADDMAQVQSLRDMLLRQLTEKNEVEYTQGLNMLGTRLVGGVLPRLEVWFEASGPTEGAVFFSIRAAVEASKRWSVLPVDPTERQVSAAPSLSPRLYRKGFVYSVSWELRRRIGRERFWGAWTSTDGKALRNAGMQIGAHTVSHPIL
ncbi:MAG: glycosyltransferase family 39 protein, partial [Myxococcales bacterium]